MMMDEDVEHHVVVRGKQHESSKEVQFADVNEYFTPFEYSTQPKQDLSSHVSLGVGESPIISCHLLLHLIDDAVDILRQIVKISNIYQVRSSLCLRVEALTLDHLCNLHISFI